MHQSAIHDNTTMEPKYVAALISWLALVPAIVYVTGADVAGITAITLVNILLIGASLFIAMSGEDDTGSHSVAT